MNTDPHARAGGRDTVPGPQVSRHTCPKCQERGMAIAVRLPAVDQAVAFSLCGCFEPELRIDGRQECLRPHDDVIRALGRKANDLSNLAGVASGNRQHVSRR